jgi:hypothetical protein
MATTLSTIAETVGPNTPFSQLITVLIDSIDPITGEPTLIPSPSPVVTVSYTDLGVTVTTATGLVTIAGEYKTIITTAWTYNDLNNNPVTSITVPELGTFNMITKVDSPPNLKELCVYTIDGAAFTHTVDLGSYSGIASMLTTLLTSLE